MSERNGMWIHSAVYISWYHDHDDYFQSYQTIVSTNFYFEQLLTPDANSAAVSNLEQKVAATAADDVNLLIEDYKANCATVSWSINNLYSVNRN